MTISKPSNIKTPNATGRAAQPTKDSDVKTISLENSLQTLMVIDTPVKGYIFGIIRLRDAIPTGKAGEHEDWTYVHSAGGFGMQDMLVNIFAQVSSHIGEIWGSEDVKQQAIEELLGDVRQDLADERQSVIAKRTA